MRRCGRWAICDDDVAADMIKWGVHGVIMVRGYCWQDDRMLHVCVPYLSSARAVKRWEQKTRDVAVAT